MYDVRVKSRSSVTLGLTAREKKFLDKSWATYFADYVFPNIDEDLFAVLYSDNPAYVLSI
jgi:hypothetical protein